jgi:hypothetical protein
VADVGKPRVFASSAYEETNSSRAWHNTSVTHWASFLFSCCGEWRTRATCRPKFKVSWDTGEPQSFEPAPNASEEMTLDVAFEVFRLDLLDVSFIDEPFSDLAIFHQLSAPLSGERVEFIQIDHTTLGQSVSTYLLARLF